MAVVRVSPVPPTPGTLISAAYSDPDYRDAFRVSPACGDRVEDFATAFFASQPGWLAKVSMNLGDKKSRHDAIKGANEYAEGSSIGSWKIHGRTNDEIMFGEHMGFMEYRFSMLRRPDGAIEAATSVKYLKRFGHLYFGVVKPFHIGFIKLALRNTSSHAASAMAPAGAS